MQYRIRFYKQNWLLINIISANNVLADPLNIKFHKSIFLFIELIIKLIHTYLNIALNLLCIFRLLDALVYSLLVQNRIKSLHDEGFSNCILSLYSRDTVWVIYALVHLVLYCDLYRVMVSSSPGVVSFDCWHCWEKMQI